MRYRAISWYYKTKERFQFWVAWRLPKWLVYFATIRLVAYATKGKYGNAVVPELTAMDAVKRWGETVWKSPSS